LPRSDCCIFFRYWDPAIHFRFLSSGITSHGFSAPAYTRYGCGGVVINHKDAGLAAMPARRIT